MAKQLLYKYVRVNGKGWRYCRAWFAGNGKVVQDAVLVDGQKEVHQEGCYYLLVDKQWVKVGANAQEAFNEQKRRVAQHQYEIATGESFPDRDTGGELLADAAAAFLASLEGKVACKSRRPKTLDASRNAVMEFVTQSGIKFLKDVDESAVTRHMAWAIRNSPTNSARTAANKFLLILQMLKRSGHVPEVREGRVTRPLGLKDAPKFTEPPVTIYSPGELAKFFAACTPVPVSSLEFNATVPALNRETAVFTTFLRSGLRDKELATLRRKDCILDGPAPCLKVVERPEYGFVPKWYSVRSVLVDPKLATMLKRWLGTHISDLVFPSATGKVDGHLLRLCERVAKKAGLDPEECDLHKFRRTFACHCLHHKMDLESLRVLMGHRDTESLARYIRAMEKPELALQVAEIWAEPQEKAASAAA
jgi:integrase